MRNFRKIFIFVLLLALCLKFCICIYSNYKKNSYFPKNLFSYDLKEKWYAENLFSLKEPSLYTKKQNDEKSYFRFFYLRTFDHPLSIRIEIDLKKNEANLYYKECNGAGGYDPGKLVKDKLIKLSKDEISKFEYLYKSLVFEDLPTEQNDAGFDGAQWIVEVNQDGKYHLVDRWSPEEGLFRDFCLYFIEFSNIDIQDIY